MKRRGCLVIGCSVVLLGPASSPTAWRPTWQDVTPQKPNGSSQHPQGQDPQGQNPNSVDPAPIPANKFLDGWMAEFLLADRKLAHQAYLAAMDRPDLPDHQSSLAILRLWESNWIDTDRDHYKKALQLREVWVEEDKTWSKEGFPETIEFARAVAAGDERRLAELRTQVAEYIAENPQFRSRRKLIKSELLRLRQPVGSDRYLEDLKQRLKVAQEKGDKPLANRLQQRIRSRRSIQEEQERRQSMRQRVNSARLLGKRWADMTQLHLMGQHRRAEGMESLAGNRDRFYSRSVVPTRESLQATIDGWDQATKAARLDDAIQHLEEMTRWRLLDQERSVLAALRERIMSLQAAGQIEPALQLIARTPYRDRVFRRR